MNTRTLKSLNEAIAKVASPVSQSNVAKGFVNSLTGKARQVHEAEEKKENEKSESPFHEKKEGSGHETDELVKRLAAKALKKARKKAGKPSTDDQYAGSKPKAGKSDPDMKNARHASAIAEMAAPGYENWASDPKVKASFKKQYGKRWKQVMYGHSWNMKKMNEETEQLDELSTQLLHRAKYAANIRRKLSKKTGEALHKKFTRELQKRGDIPQKPKTWAERESQWMEEDVQLNEEWGGGFQSSQDAHREVQAGLRREASAHRKMVVSDIKAVLSGKMTKNAFTRKHKIKFGEHTLAKRMAAKAKARRLAESEQLDEAGYKRLGRIKAAAYKAELASRMDPKTPAEDNKVMNAVVKHIKAKRAAAEREAQVAAGMARRGGASPDAVRGGGSRIGPSGKYTQKAGALANQRDKALAKFRSRAGYNKAQGMSRSSTEKQISRNTQQFQDEIRNRSRSGDFGQDNQAALRARSNFQKRFGRLKGK